MQVAFQGTPEEIAEEIRAMLQQFGFDIIPVAPATYEHAEYPPPEDPLRAPKPEPKPAKKAKAAAPKKPVQAAPAEPVEDDEPYEVEIPEDGPPPEPVDTIGNEKVKAEVIQTLQELFAQGKVKIVRHVLDNYGDGAKSFPEIEASKFPEIKEALAKGIAA